MTAVTVTVTVTVLLFSRTGADDYFVLNARLVGAALDAEVPFLPPVRVPRVGHLPVPSRDRGVETEA